MVESLPMTDLLTHKQLLFIEHYIQTGGNGTAAARASGYKGSTATLGAVAYENLNKPHIRDEIRRRQAEFRDYMTVTTEAKRQQLWTIANQCMEMDPMAAIKAIQELNRMDGDYAPARLSRPAWSIEDEILQVRGE
jgi:phage terminase small subunit